MFTPENPDFRALPNFSLQELTPRVDRGIEGQNLRENYENTRKKE